MATGRRWWQRSLLHRTRVTVVPPAEFVPMQEAMDALRVGRPTVNLLATTGWLQYAATHEPPWYVPDIGVTRTSFQLELPRWRDARARERLGNRVDLFFSALWRSI